MYRFLVSQSETGLEEGAEVVMVVVELVEGL